jgi:hypothetical protein
LKHYFVCGSVAVWEELPAKVMLGKTLVLMQMTFLNNVRKVDRLVLSRTSCFDFTVVMYLNQFRAVKGFLEKITIMGNVIGVPQNMEYLFRVPSVNKG